MGICHAAAVMMRWKLIADEGIASSRKPFVPARDRDTSVLARRLHLLPNFALLAKFVFNDTFREKNHIPSMMTAVAIPGGTQLACLQP